MVEESANLMLPSSNFLYESLTSTSRTSIWESELNRLKYEKMVENFILRQGWPWRKAQHTKQAKLINYAILSVKKLSTFCEHFFRINKL